MIQLRPSIFALVLSSLALPACVVDDSGPPVVVVGDGLFTLRWTIEETTDPGACDYWQVDSIDVLVTRPNGRVVGDFLDDCAAFETSIELAPGTYYADATLLDNGAAATTTVDLGRFVIYGDDELIVDAEFPADSFF